MALALASIDLCRIIQSGCSLCSFSVYVVFLFFQVILSSKSWKGFQNFSSLSVRQVLDVMFKSRADATAKTYIRVIKKFMDWCKSRQICMQLPFPLGVVSLYLLEVQQSCTSSSSVILAHAALKWLHSFVPSLDRNPLDSDFCRNIVESAKRHKSQPIMQKEPITTEIIKNILDVYSKENANLKDLRIAALCSLAFAGFFRYDELCNIVPKHIEFCSGILGSSCLVVRQIFIEKGIMSILVNPSLSTALLVSYEGTWIYLALTYVVLFLCLDLLFFTVVVLAIP